MPPSDHRPDLIKIFTRGEAPVPASKVMMATRLGLAALGLTVASAAFGLGGQVPTDGPKPPVAAAGADAAKMAKGRELFANWSCNSCHALSDAGADGHVGPAFDGNAELTEAFVVNRVTNGQGPMPAFGGQMTDDEIATIAAYIVKAHK
jgi:mono/diheme cytochrome c family protein